MPIAAKLLQVMKQTGYVQRSSRNREQNYTFASEGAFIEHVRPAMLDAGVICYPLDIKQQVGLTPKGTQVLVQGSVTFRFIDAEDGSFIDLEAPFSGADSTDKASYKAMTGARKYALRQALLIETGDDPERDEKPEPNPAVAAKVETAAKSAARASLEAQAPFDEWQKHGKVLVKNTTPVTSAAYAEQLRRLGLSNTEACKLIGVESMKAGRPDKTLDEVLQEVAVALAAANAAQAEAATKILDGKVSK